MTEENNRKEETVTVAWSVWPCAFRYVTVRQKCDERKWLPSVTRKQREIVWGRGRVKTLGQ